MKTKFASLSSVQHDTQSNNLLQTTYFANLIFRKTRTTVIQKTILLTFGDGFTVVVINTCFHQNLMLVVSASNPFVEVMTVALSSILMEQNWNRNLCGVDFDSEKRCRHSCVYTSINVSANTSSNAYQHFTSGVILCV